MVVKHAVVNVILGIFISLIYTNNVIAAPVSYASPVSTPVATPDGTAADPEAIVKGQIDNLGGIDLVTVNDKNGTVTVLINNDDGTFSAPVSYPVGTRPLQAAIGDLNNDGFNDLVIPNTSSGNVTVYLNDGDGTFTEEPTESPLALGGEPTAPVIANFNGDAFLDVAITNATTNSVHILISDGDGTFTPGTPIVVGAKPTSIAQGNLDNALGTDLVVANYDGATVDVFTGDGAGGFTPSQTLSTGARPWSLHLASMEDGVNDPAGNLDLVLANYNANTTVRVYKGLGDGTFNTTVLSQTDVQANKPHSIEIADLDNDTFVDVVVANDDELAVPATTAATGVTVLLGDGTGDFSTVTHYPFNPLSDQPNGVVSLDLDGLNLLDLAVANGSTGNVDVLLSVPTANAPVASDDTLAVNEDVATNGTLAATDADGTVLLTYSIVANGTSGTAVITNPATGAYTYTPNTDVNGVDVDTFTFKANDGTADSNTATITVTITPVNDIPVRSAGTVSDLTVLEDSGLTSLGLGSLAYGPGGGADEAAQTLTYAVTAVPSASLGDVVLVDGTTVVAAGAYSLAQIQGMQFRTATDAAGGPATFSFTAQDNGGTANSGVDTLTESLTITVTGVNDVPALTAGTVSDLTVLEDSGLTSLGLGTLAFGPGGAADEAAQTLTYAVTAVPSASLGDVVLTDGTTVVAAGAYSLAQIQGMQFRTATDAAGGPATFSFTVQDNGGTANSGVDTLTESLTITVTGVNDVPALTAGTVSNLTVLEDSGLTSLGLGSLAYGPGGGADEAAQTLTYAVTAVPSASLGDVVLTDGTTVVAAGAYSLAQIQGMQFRTTSNANGGPATFSFTVQDNGGTANSGVDTLAESLTINVTAVNDAPTISGSPATNAVQDDPYSFTPTASDVDGPSLTFSINTTPTWASFDTGTGALTGTPSNADVGNTTNNIVISVSDGIAADVSLTAFNLTVSNTNDAPTISGTPATTVAEGSPYSFTPTASDLDVGDTLTFSITNQPTWASFDTATGALTGTPTFTAVGTTTGIVISVSDNTATVSLPAFDLEVTALDSNSDGISDGQAAAIGLDPQSLDTDGDGISDAVEVGVNPASPTDSDGDGVIDALEFGAADANTLGFIVPAPTATTLSLTDLSGKQVILSGNGAAMTANVNGATGLPLYAESDLAVADASFTYPFGVYDFSVAAPAGTATVTLTLPAGTVIPTNAVVRKLNASNQWQTLTTGAVIDRIANTITLTLTDNDGVFDLDNTVGLIRDPVGVAVPVATASGGGGGGGCSLNADPRRAGFDPILPLMALASMLYLRRQRKQNVA